MKPLSVNEQWQARLAHSLPLRTSSDRGALINTRLQPGVAERKEGRRNRLNGFSLLGKLLKQFFLNAND